MQCTPLMQGLLMVTLVVSFLPIMYELAFSITVFGALFFVPAFGLEGVATSTRSNLPHITADGNPVPGLPGDVSAALLPFSILQYHINKRKYRAVIAAAATGPTKRIVKFTMILSSSYRTILTTTKCFLLHHRKGGKWRFTFVAVCGLV